MRLALLGDIHHYKLNVSVRGMFSKRVLGQSNLWLNRRRSVLRHLLPSVVDQIKALEPDVLLLSGDLTTTSQPREFDEIAALLKPLTDHCRAVAVPGNHDKYTFKSRRTQRMAEAMQGIMPGAFPYVTALRGRWSLLALDAAVPRAWGARGALGEEQMHEAERYLDSLEPGHGVIVLCHYPAMTPPPPEGPPVTWGHGLENQGRLLTALRHCRARVIMLHGHIHKPWAYTPDDEAHQHLSFINAGAPCMVSNHYPLGQGFWTIDLQSDSCTEIKAIHHAPSKDALAGGNVPKRRNRRIGTWDATHRL